MIIESLLDTDLYKFTMQQAVWHRFADARVEYRFACRDAGIDLGPLADRIRAEVDALGQLRFQPDEIEYLRSLGFFAGDYLEFLRGLRLDPTAVDIQTANGFRLRIKGRWLDTILFEVPVLAIINECYFEREANRDGLFAAGRRRLEAKLDLIQNPIAIAEFGTRRRFSRAWHDRLLGIIQEHPAAGAISATSNVFFARKYGLAPVGTMAHEYLQACQALAPLEEFQTFALKAWLDEYKDQLGIALTDVVGIRAFLADFDRDLAERYSGLRHDSGDPYHWADAVLDHYEALGIDSRTKTLVFSDGLDLPTALELQRRLGHRARVLFGIGTNLTNDLGPRPLNIVIKMVRCNAQPVAKISDSPGKGMCEDQAFVERLKRLYSLAGSFH